MERETKRISDEVHHRHATFLKDLVTYRENVTNAWAESRKTRTRNISSLCQRHCFPYRFMSSSSYLVCVGSSLKKEFLRRERERETADRRQEIDRMKKLKVSLSSQAVDVCAVTHVY